MLNGLLVLLFFQCVGEAVKLLTGVPLPGSIIGMFLLFFALCLRQEVPEGLGRASQQLIRHLGLMFVPPSAGLFFLGPQFNDQWPAIIVALVVGTLVSLAFSGWLMKRLVGDK